MNETDARRAKAALAQVSVIFKGMVGRDDGLVDPIAADELLAPFKSSGPADMLAGHLRASGTALSRLAIERRSSIPSAAADAKVRLRRMASTEAAQRGDDRQHRDAETAVDALVRMKVEKATLRPAELFGDPNRAMLAFSTLLLALVHEIADHRRMPPVDVCLALSAEIDSVTER